MQGTVAVPKNISSEKRWQVGNEIILNFYTFQSVTVCGLSHDSCRVNSVRTRQDSSGDDHVSNNSMHHAIPCHV